MLETGLAFLAPVLPIPIVIAQHWIARERPIWGRLGAVSIWFVSILAALIGLAYLLRNEQWKTLTFLAVPILATMIGVTLLGAIAVQTVLSSTPLMIRGIALYFGSLLIGAILGFAASAVWLGLLWRN